MDIWVISSLLCKFLKDEYLGAKLLSRREFIKKCQMVIQRVYIILQTLLTTFSSALGIATLFNFCKSS